MSKSNLSANSAGGGTVRRTKSMEKSTALPREEVSGGGIFGLDPHAGREKDGQWEGRSWGVKGEQSHPAFVCLSDWECQIMQPEVEGRRGGPPPPLGGRGKLFSTTPLSD